MYRDRPPPGVNKRISNPLTTLGGVTMVIPVNSVGPPARRSDAADRRQLEDEHQPRRGARAGRGPDRRRWRRSTGVECVICPPFVWLPLVYETIEGTCNPARRAEHALGGAGRLHRRDRAGHGRGVLHGRHHRSFGAPPVLRRDRRGRQQEGRGCDPRTNCCRSSASARTWPSATLVTTLVVHQRAR